MLLLAFPIESIDKSKDILQQMLAEKESSTDSLKVVIITMAEMDEDNTYENEPYETIPVNQNARSTQDKKSFELLTMNTQTGTDEPEQLQANVAYGQLTRTNDSQKVNRKCVATRKAKMFVALFLVLLLLAVTVVAIALSVSNTISIQISIVRELRNDISLLTSQLNDLQNDLDSFQSMLGYETASNCGPGLWQRVAYLNMSDPSQQCPPVWREYSANGVRACGRATGRNCTSMSYSVSHFYSKVCGRVIGYQVGSPNAFADGGGTIDGTYVDGISITYGSPRQHIWTYASGLSEVLINPYETSSCPCSDNGTRLARNPPSFVANNYYCESGNPNNTYEDTNTLRYTNDPLWDGQNCEGRCCSDGRNPPWFSVQLTERTTSDIEVRICGSQQITNEDSPIELLELYVQLNVMLK